MSLTIPGFPAAPAPVPMLPRTDRAAVWTSVPTDHPVAFITVDDGYPGNDNAALADQVQAAQLPLTIFMTFYAASSGLQPQDVDDNPAAVAHVAYLRKFQTGGKRVGNHAKTHTHLPQLAYVDQYDSIYKARTWGLPHVNLFGAQPVLFRPPYGEYNADTLKAAWANGHQVAVLWTWTASQVAAGAPVRRGDIILTHFDAMLEQDLQAILGAFYAAGLTPAWLEDYVQ